LRNFLNKNPFLKYFFTGVSTFCLGFLIAHAIPSEKNLSEVVSSNIPFVKTDSNTLDDLPTQTLTEAYRALKNNYYGFSTVQKETLVE
jgi:hypothetical protein